MKVLIVDDDSLVLKLLEGLLLNWGYEIELATDGEAAMEIMSDPQKRPQIAVLDWVMPCIDGIELCKNIKGGKKKYGFIYTILLTGKNEKKDIIIGLDAGADDYLTKPINPAELKSRLHVGVRIVEYEQELKKHTRQLEEQNEALEKYARILESLAEERARQLIHSERLSTLGELSAGIAHEINNYLSPVAGYTEMLEIQTSKLEEIIPPEITNAFSIYIKGINESSEKIRNLMERIRTHSRKSGGDKSYVSVNNVLTHSIELCTSKLRKFKLVKNLAKNIGLTLINIQEIEQVLINVLKNAAEALEGRIDGIISVKTYQDNDFACVSIADNGTGIPEDELEKIWDSFFTTKPTEKGTGLGLSISKSIIEEHGGTIEARNNPEKAGAEFIIKLPVKKFEQT